MRRAHGKEARLDKLIDMFLREVPSHLEQIDEYYLDLDFKKLADVSHSLKGVAGNLGAERLMLLASDIELGAKDENNDLESYIGPLKGSFADVPEAMLHYRRDCK
ncbi:MAG: Hpt domain-containing protein [Gammaproteobacteria bacterium]|nr:Hpt domain-containing protein [Gammaproteobacteria bacterium]